MLKKWLDRYLNNTARDEGLPHRRQPFFYNADKRHVPRLMGWKRNLENGSLLYQILT